MADYDALVKDYDGEKKENMLGEARAFNEKIKARAFSLDLTPVEEAEYKKTLNITETGIMGYIEIPKINVSYPIYHGIEEATLQVAIGHLSGTSLPVGGIGTHTVLSGHRGLPSAKLFSDLDELVVGDTFTIQTLDQTLAYEVDQILIVLPTEIDSLRIEPDKDLVSLVTCTPYGINSHRLLVRGHRVDYRTGADFIPGEALLIEEYVVAWFIAIPILFCLVIRVFVSAYLRSKDYKK